MTGETVSTAEQMKQAVREIRRLRGALADAERRRAGPVAIIGVGLRLPAGIVDLADFESLLLEGRQAITEVPPERWRTDEIGDGVARHGAFLDEIDAFDAEFFGISGTEAASMDPQQRLVLETGWQALEDAGLAPDGFAGRRLGVYLGISNSDYGRMLLSDMPAIDPYFTSGSAFSVAAGRLSYFLGATGPSLAVDTACSSSLVALHLAANALRSGECDVALAGGINIMLSPEVHVNFSRAGMLARDGRCKTFDAAADGYVRGEGCILFALRRLSDAEAGGDRILAVMRGSAVNQDGRSNGLTAPNGPAQEAAIRAALAEAGVAPEAVGYVEAHGTGTPLGDPIEIGALAAALGRDRPDATPLAVGSVKTNLGHLEAAAGAAGVLKAIVALRTGRIPAHLNFAIPNGHIDWPGLAIRVPTEAVDWPRGEAPRLAGVSSFGFSGTNAHLLLEEAPAPAASPEQSVLPHHVFTLAARTPRALAALAGHSAEAVARGDAALGDLCHSANSGRARLSYRMAAAAVSGAELATELAAFAGGQAVPGLATGVVEPGAEPRTAFLFTGQGSQYPGMGRAFYETLPPFRDAIDACAGALGDKVPGGLIDALFMPEADSRIHDPRVAQPALFAVEYALAQLWMSFGLRPAAVAGHSLGEFVAATVAGLMPMEDALGLVAERGRLTAEGAADGAMAVVFADAETIVAALDGEAGVEIAAFNGPANHVLSGPRPALERVLAPLAEAGNRVEPLRVAYAAHSALVEPLLPRFREAAERVRFGRMTIPLVSNVTGRFATGEALACPEHWVEHLRRPVRFAQGIATLLGFGVSHFVEMGPHPVLSAMAAECSEAGGAVFLASLRRDAEPGRDLAEAVGRLFVDGAPVDPDALEFGRGRRRVPLPTYPFERRRHWHPSASRRPADTQDAAAWTRVSRRLDREMERGPLGFDPGACLGKWDALAALSRALVLELLHESGLFAETEVRHDATEVATRLGAKPDFVPLVGRWLAGLARAGLLVAEPEGYRAPQPLPAADRAAAMAHAEAALADNRPLLDYVRHCAGLLGPVIRGAASPLETLFPGGDFALALGLYERSATMRYMNGLAAAGAEAIFDAERRPLRVLEVGAGVGGTTSAVLDALEGRRVRYLFTDVSDFFLDHARARFAGRQGMSYAHFNLDRDPAEQGIAGGFDLVLASNAVHAVRDLPAALRRLRGLLRPGGVLMLVESTTHFDWFEVTTGLIEGWRSAEDDLRDEVALIDAPRWLVAARAAGFAEAEAWPRVGTAAEAVGQHLILARAPEDVEAAHGVTIDEVPQTRTADEPTEAAEPEIAAILAAVAEALPRERPAALAELVRARVMAVLRRRSDQPPGDRERLLDLGLDSLMAVQLRNRLAQDLGIGGGLPATLVFDQPTISAIADFLANRLMPAAAMPQPGPAAVVQATPSSRARVLADMNEEEVEALLMERLNR